MLGLERYTLVLLPGLDGTGTLFAGFRALVQGPSVVTVVYPPDRYETVEQLAERVIQAVDGRADVVLVAESYSGRVAVEVARRRPGAVRALVLVASFLGNPSWVPGWAASVVPDLLFAVRPPTWLVRQLLVGADAPDELVSAVGRAIGAVDPRVLAARLRDVLRAECTPHAGGGPPLLYLAARRDRLVGAAAIADLRTHGYVVQLQAVEAPHLLLQLSPSEAWRHIRCFLLTLPASSPEGA